MPIEIENENEIEQDEKQTHPEQASASKISTKTYSNLEQLVLEKAANLRRWCLELKLDKIANTLAKADSACLMEFTKNHLAQYSDVPDEKVYEAAESFLKSFGCKTDVLKDEAVVEKLIRYCDFFNECYGEWAAVFQKALKAPSVSQAFSKAT